MLERPALELSLRAHREFLADGELAERSERFARRWAEWMGLVGLPPVRLTVTAAPPQHVGLGLGTQLGLSVAAGLTRFFGHDDVPLDQLARQCGRGARSSVGTYGFRHGGLIAENGKLADETLGQLIAHVELPTRWRIVLFRPRGLRGLAGRSEQLAFGRLPPVDDRSRDRLWRELAEGILPAAQQGDLPRFGESVYRYGRQAGLCFAAHQGGPFASPELASWVARARDWGVAGVGQSSWGPTLFAILDGQQAAEAFVQAMRQLEGGEDLATTITPAARGGAVITESAATLPS